LADVEYNAIRVANIATWNGCILFLYGAACGGQSAFRRLHIRYQEIKYRTVLSTSLDVQAEGARFKSQERFASVRDRQAKN
jgi:hypothetical protein